MVENTGGRVWGECGCGGSKGVGECGYKCGRECRHVSTGVSMVQKCNGGVWVQGRVCTIE